MRATNKHLLLATILVVICMWGQRCVNASAPAAAEMLPPETMGLIEIKNLKGLCEKFKQTSIYGLYTSPEMRPFIDPTEKKLRDKLDEFLKKVWKELGVENMPTELPLPQGHVGLAVFVNVRSSEVPDYSQINHSEMKPEDWENMDTNSLPKRTVQVPDTQMVLFAQMGEKLAEAKKLAKVIEAKTIDEGSLRQRETIRGVQINILKKEADSDVNIDAFCYGFKDDLLIVGSSLKYIREFLVRQGETDRPTLAKEGNYKAVLRKLGDAELKFYLNGPALIKLIKEFASDEEKVKTAQIIETLGLGNLGGIGYHIQVSPSPVEDFRLSGLLGVQGKKKGIPALLSPVTRPVELNRLITENSSSFLLAHYDIGQIYDGILEMVFAISGYNPTPWLDGMLGMTGDPANGRPPVKLRQDVLGQLAPAITFVSRMEKPYDSAESVKMLFAFGVRDGQSLNNALQRIHSIFIAQGNKELQRELLGSQIYLLPGSEMILSAMMASQGAEMDDPSKLQMAFAVAGDQLVLGAVDQVEQSIRDLGRKSLEGIKTDPMYQHVARYLPEKVGIAFYENYQIETERAWWLLKEAARKAAIEASKTPKVSSYDLGMMLGSGEPPLQVLVKYFSDYADFTTLPNYTSVKKYFGAGVGYVSDDSEGIYAYGVSVKSPKSSE
jgi:hypothetical protein